MKKSKFQELIKENIIEKNLINQLILMKNNYVRHSYCLS